MQMVWASLMSQPFQCLNVLNVTLLILPSNRWDIYSFYLYFFGQPFSTLKYWFKGFVSVLNPLLTSTKNRIKLFVSKCYILSELFSVLCLTELARFSLKLQNCCSSSNPTSATNVSSTVQDITLILAFNATQCFSLVYGIISLPLHIKTIVNVINTVEEESIFQLCSALYCTFTVPRLF